MVVHAGRNFKAEEHSRRAPRAPVQLRRVHDAVHVSFFTFIFNVMLSSLSLSHCFPPPPLGNNKLQFFFTFIFNLSNNQLGSELCFILFSFFLSHIQLIFNFQGYYCCLNLSFSLILKYRNIYNMCIQKPPKDYSEQLYEKYKDAFVEYLKSSVRQLNG